MSALATSFPVNNREPLTRFLRPTLRILFGAAFALFGLNGFLNFLPQTATPLPAPAMAFAGALVQTGYMFPLIFGTQLMTGILLLANRFVPLALVLIAPFLLNSLAFHLFLEHSGLPMSALFCALEVVLVYGYRASFRSLVIAQS